jgi:glycosyltransferase involved in cell wall biosynthesis
MTHRRPWLKKASFRMLEARIVKHAALMHYTSDQERREAETLDVTTASVVIPNALPDRPRSVERGAFRQRFCPPQSRRVVLFLSRLDEKKGLDLLLRAYVEVRALRPEAVLVIAGDGPRDFVAKVKADAVKLGLGEADVVWTGFLSGDAKEAVLADADLFVLPSYSENFGIAVAEAMAAGLPVVVSDQVGIHQDVRSARAGIVVPCDAQKLAEALVKLLADPELGGAMGARGEALVRRRYSSEAVTRQLIGVYNDVADRARRAS